MKSLRLQNTVHFLIYDNRSGSTLLSGLLNNLEEIGVTLESPFLLYMLTGRKIYKTWPEVHDALKMIYRDAKFLDWGLEKTHLERNLRQNIPLTPADFVHVVLKEYFRTNKPKAKYWIYKGASIFLLRKISQVFPDSKIIYIYRDGRAVFCSKKQSVNLNIKAMMETDPVKAAKIWTRNLQMINKFSLEYQVIKVKYENLVEDASSELKRIYRFITGADYSLESVSVDSLQYFKKIPESQMILHQNVAKKPIRSKITAWKKDITFAEGYFYEKEAHKMLREMGYELFYQDLAEANKHMPEIRKLQFKLYSNRAVRLYKSMVYFVSRPVISCKKLSIRLDPRLRLDR